MCSYYNSYKIIALFLYIIINDYLVTTFMFGIDETYLPLHQVNLVHVT